MVKRHRSPAYPSHTLTDSVVKAKQLYDKEGKHPVPVQVAVTHWGYAPKSSGGMLTISALKAFGLMEDEGSGKDRMIKLTSRGLDIVRDEREVSPERVALLIDAALTPKIIRELVDAYPDGKASPETLKYFLVKKEFNPNAVSDVLKVYNDAKNYLILKDEHDNSIDELNQVEIGDYVQWESLGVLQFETPKKVTSVDNELGYVEVEGSSTGIPIAEIEVIPEPNNLEAAPLQRNSGGALNNTPKLNSSGGDMRQETFALDTGDVVIQWPSKMTQESFEDFSDWLDILKRKVKRNIEAKEGVDSTGEKVSFL